MEQFLTCRGGKASGVESDSQKEETEITEFDLEDYEYKCVIVAGVDPSKFWTNTLRQNASQLESFSLKEKRNLEYVQHLHDAVYDSVITMGGKKAFKIDRIEKKKHMDSATAGQFIKDNLI